MAVSPDRVVVRPDDCFSGLVDRRGERVARFTEGVEYRECWEATRCSVSRPLSPANWPRLPHTKDGVKEHVRHAVGPAVRKMLWLTMAGVMDVDSVLFAKAFGEPVDDAPLEQLDTMFGCPFNLQALPTFCVKPAFPAAFDRVLTGLVYSHRYLSTCPLLPILTRIFLHFMEEWESYAVLVKLLGRRAWLDQNPREVRASHATFLALCHSHARSMVHDLRRLRPVGVSEENFLHRLTQHWYSWPFHQQPFWLMVRVVDLYVVEGPKVLYRLGLAALKLYTAHIQAIPAGQDIAEEVQHFLRGLSQQMRAQWFHNAFTSFRRLPWNTVLRQWQHFLSLLPSSQDQPDAPLPLLAYQRTVIPDPSSEILSGDQWLVLWAWLPEWVTCEEPQCLFRASRDGYNLRTLFRKCEDVQPVLLLVRTTLGEIFGAFIASKLCDRHGVQFFGTGETFLFSLVPRVQLYPWSGETDLILRGTESEFVVGSGGGAYGLWVDGDLDHGSSSQCLAFHNAPLTTRDSQFSCAAVEVYSCTDPINS